MIHRAVDSFRCKQIPAQEVPPVTTSASGSAVINLAADKSISGSVSVTGMEATMAHVHEAKMSNGSGPVIISLSRTGDNEWSIPADTKLTDDQLQSLKAGSLYINVHSATFKSGEIRGQLK
ncbi:MAG: hypothetical protein B7Y51_07335 [Burkholderiales bacterium 28-67-8]|nr:MAG: hypothetical protein B7Y51_07335 [Burkholderiales bacterium 28-67-8]